MIYYTGFGMWLVLAIYVLGFALLSQVVPMLVPKPEHQMYALLAYHFLAAAINFFMAKRLNRNGSVHTVYGLKLEMIVLIFGALGLVPMLLMLIDF